MKTNPHFKLCSQSYLQNQSVQILPPACRCLRLQDAPVLARFAKHVDKFSMHSTGGRPGTQKYVSIVDTVPTDFNFDKKT
jgi:hypothetical protein